MSAKRSVVKTQKENLKYFATGYCFKKSKREDQDIKLGKKNTPDKKKKDEEELGVKKINK